MWIVICCIIIFIKMIKWCYHDNVLSIFFTDNEKNFTIRGDKILCPSLFDETIVHISITIVNQIYEKKNLVSKAKVIINLVSICRHVRCCN